MAFFPQTFSTKIRATESTGSKADLYINPSRLNPNGGSVRFKILSDAPVVGYELWFEKNEGGQVPRRLPSEPDDQLIAELEAEVGGKLRIYEDGRKAITLFIAFFVYDYEAKAIKVFSAAQKAIQRELDRLTADPDYADLSLWDCQVTRKGQLLETRYSVDMKPTRAVGAVAAEVEETWEKAKAAGADLEALFTGGNPLPSAG